MQAIDLTQDSPVRRSAPISVPLPGVLVNPLRLGIVPRPVPLPEAPVGPEVHRSSPIRDPLDSGDETEELDPCDPSFSPTRPPPLELGDSPDYMPSYAPPAPPNSPADPVEQGIFSQAIEDIDEMLAAGVQQEEEHKRVAPVQVAAPVRRRRTRYRRRASVAQRPRTYLGQVTDVTQVLEPYEQMEVVQYMLNSLDWLMPCSAIVRCRYLTNEQEEFYLHLEIPEVCEVATTRGEMAGKWAGQHLREVYLSVGHTDQFFEYKDEDRIVRLIHSSMLTPADKSRFLRAHRADLEFVEV